jgi:hypothetical protein
LQPIGLQCEFDFATPPFENKFNKKEQAKQTSFENKSFQHTIYFRSKTQVENKSFENSVLKNTKAKTEF